MNAFLAGRAPDFQKFRQKAKRELDGYLRGLEKDLNTPPDMRRKTANPNSR
jgi:naphthoate synthase